MDAECRPLSQQWRTSTCEAVGSEDTFAFHTDVVRLLEVNDFRNRLWLWWQTGVAKADFEAFRKKPVAEEKARRGKQAVGDDEAISFNEDLPEDDDDGRDSQAAKERAVGENLARLKRDVSREPLRRKREREREREREKGAMPRSPRRRDCQEIPAQDQLRRKGGGNQLRERGSGYGHQPAAVHPRMRKNVGRKRGERILTARGGPMMRRTPRGGSPVRKETADHMELERP